MITRHMQYENELFHDDRVSVNGSRAKRLSYALITPARNEEAAIEWTILSVVSQTRTPEQWIIVSDGSTDRTDEIVRRYLDHYPWIELIRMPEHKDRHFASKVHCFAAGYERLKKKNLDIIGNLDGDTSFDPDYLEYLVRQFEMDPQLGVAGTPFLEDGLQAYDYKYTNIEHVTGICQMFRRQCYEDIGGYKPMKGGGIDWLAVTTARMKGWKTRTFTGKALVHHRRMGTAQASVWKSKVRQGEKDYNLGNHWLWQIFRSLYQSLRGRPFLVGGMLILWGYARCRLRGVERPIPPEVTAFARREQMERLWSAFFAWQRPSS